MKAETSSASSPLVLRQCMSTGCEGGGDSEAVITLELDPETHDSLHKENTIRIINN